MAKPNQQDIFKVLFPVVNLILILFISLNSELQPKALGYYLAPLIIFNLAWVLNKKVLSKEGRVMKVVSVILFTFMMMVSISTITSAHILVSLFISITLLILTANTQYDKV